MSLFSKNRSDQGDIIEIIPEAAENVTDASAKSDETITENPAKTAETVTDNSDMPAESSANPVIEQSGAVSEKTDNTSISAEILSSDDNTSASEQTAPVEDEAMLNFAITQEAEEQKKKSALADREKAAEAASKDDSSESEKLESTPYEEDTSKTGNAVRAFITAIILLILLVASYNLGKSGILENRVKQPVVTPLPTATPEPTPVTVFTVIDLNEYVSRLTETVTAPYKASVENLYGYEYLCLKSNNIAVYYRNEYPVGYTGKKTILIDNGIFKTEMYFDYDLTGDIESLLPMLGSFGSDDTRQLLFIDYDGKYPSKLWFIDADKLFNYGCVDFTESIRQYYSVVFNENPLAENEDKRYVLNLDFSSTVYSYAVSKETFVTGAENVPEDVINFFDDFELEFGEAGVTFSTQVKSAEKEYLGKISGSVIKSGNSFKVSGVRYGTYAVSSEAGYSEDGLITPRKSPIATYVTIVGKTGLRYYLPISDEIERIDIDWANMLVREDGSYEYVVDGEIKSIKGIDVSKFQGKIDWTKVKEAGVEFAIIRLGYRGYGFGTLELDEYYKRNIQAATDAGIKVGVYFFSEAIDVDEAIEEANFVLENIKDYDISYPVVFDTEDIPTADARANNLTFEMRTAICRAFCDTIKAAGYTPMIYANSRFMLTAIDLKQLDDIDRWFAYYGTTSTFPYSFKMFQYSETGKIDGIPTNVDLDISFVDYSKKQ